MNSKTMQKQWWATTDLREKAENEPPETFKQLQEANSQAEWEEHNISQ